MAGWRVAISDQKAKILIEMYGIVSRFVVLALCQRTGKSTNLYGFIGFRKMLSRLRWRPQLSSVSSPHLLLVSLTASSTLSAPSTSASHVTCHSLSFLSRRTWYALWHHVTHFSITWNIVTATTPTTTTTTTTTTTNISGNTSMPHFNEATSKLSWYRES